MEKSGQHTPFIAHLEGWDSDDLFLVERQVRELIESPGYEALQALIGAASDSAMTRLKHGSTILDQAQYARILGWVGGLESLKVAAEAVLIVAERTEQDLKARDRDSVAAGR